jgi:hypothetical protein
MTGLPPDPDQLNAARAEWADQALRYFQHLTGTESEDALCDLLCDLRHWCDRNGQGYDAADHGAEQHYQVETGGKDPLLGL